MKINKRRKSGIDAKADYSKSDMFQFATIIKKILPSFFEIHYDKNRMNGITNIIEQCRLEELDERPKDMKEFQNMITPYLITVPKWKFRRDVSIIVEDGKIAIKIYENKNI